MGYHFNLALLVILLALANATGGDHDKVRKCNIHNLNDCPDLTTCTESGECRCWPDYVYNVAHEKNASAEYCVYKPSQHPNAGGSGVPTITGSAAATPASSSSAGSNAGSGKTASAISQHEPPGAHHLVGGILIPVLFVLVTVGVVYSVKRLHLVRRAREAFTRRNRPFYEDVMMGNDNDDPPLI